MVLNGIYSNTIFRNSKIGYTIFRFQPEEKCEYRDIYGHIRCKGYLPLYINGTPLSLEGKWEKTEYGETFLVSSVIEKVTNEQTAINYLTEICEGIGPKTAKRIIDEYGLEIFNHVADNDFEKRLAEVKNVTAEKAKKLTDSLRKTVIQRKIFEYIAPFGGDYLSALKLYNAHGIAALDLLKRDPYKIGYEIGMPFYVRDWIAYNQGVSCLNKERLKNLIYEAMYRAAALGHTYILLKDLKLLVRSLSKKSAFPEEIPASVIARSLPQMKGIIIEENEKIYLKKYYDAEKEIARQIYRIEKNKVDFAFTNEVREWAKKSRKDNLGKEQEAALDVLQESGIKIITGGPGVGKTTTLKEIIRIFEKINPGKEIRLAAPTGAAAQRMAASTNREATTIHRLIEYKPFDGYESCVDQLSGDVFIIDEMSMVDTLLFAMLLKPIPSNALIILVGDEDQLSAVGPGNVLHDLIQAGVPTYRLNEVFRQSGKNSIVDNYRKIHEKDWKLICDNQFEIQIVDTVEDMQKSFLDIVEQYSEKGMFSSLQILSTTVKYECGTVAINKMIQKKINGSERGITFGIYEYKVHDRVLLTRNNYDKWYYNGDIGEITEIAGEKVTVSIAGHEVTLENEELDDMSLAYAITTHKAQGSEYPIVIVLLPMEPVNMLQLKLFGTAISRAKEKVYVIGQKGTFEIIQSGRNDRKRYTGLCERIKKIFLI